MKERVSLYIIIILKLQLGFYGGGGLNVKVALKVCKEIKNVETKHNAKIINC